MISSWHLWNLWHLVKVGRGLEEVEMSKVEKNEIILWRPKKYVFDYLWEQLQIHKDFPQANFHPGFSHCKQFYQKPVHLWWSNSIDLQRHRPSYFFALGKKFSNVHFLSAQKCLNKLGRNHLKIGSKICMYTRYTFFVKSQHS